MSQGMWVWVTAKDADGMKLDHMVNLAAVAQIERQVKDAGDGTRSRLHFGDGRSLDIEESPEELIEPRNRVELAAAA